MRKINVDGDSVIILNRRKEKEQNFDYRKIMPLFTRDVVRILRDKNKKQPINIKVNVKLPKISIPKVSPQVALPKDLLGQLRRSMKVKMPKVLVKQVGSRINYERLNKMLLEQVKIIAKGLKMKGKISVNVHEKSTPLG